MMEQYLLNASVAYKKYLAALQAVAASHTYDEKAAEILHEYRKVKLHLQSELGKRKRYLKGQGQVKR
jgi:spore maturation protein CgeB